MTGLSAPFHRMTVDATQDWAFPPPAGLSWCFIASPYSCHSTCQGRNGTFDSWSDPLIACHCQMESPVVSNVALNLFLFDTRTDVHTTEQPVPPLNGRERCTGALQFVAQDKHNIVVNQSPHAIEKKQVIPPISPQPQCLSSCNHLRCKHNAEWKNGGRRRPLPCVPSGPPPRVHRSCACFTFK